MCSELLSQSCHTVSSVCPFCTTSEISSLAPCSISYHFQIQYHCLSNRFFRRTFMLFLTPKSTLFIHLVFTCFLFPGLKLMLALVLFQLLSLIFGTIVGFITALSVGDYHKDSPTYSSACDEECENYLQLLSHY